MGVEGGGKAVATLRLRDAHRESGAQERGLVEFGTLSIWVMTDYLGQLTAGMSKQGSLEGWEEKHHHLKRKGKRR